MLLVLVPESDVSVAIILHVHSFAVGKPVFYESLEVIQMISWFYFVNVAFFCDDSPYYSWSIVHPVALVDGLVRENALALANPKIIFPLSFVDTPVVKNPRPVEY